MREDIFSSPPQKPGTHKRVLPRRCVATESCKHEQPELPLPLVLQQFRVLPQALAKAGDQITVKTTVPMFYWPRGSGQKSGNACDKVLAARSSSKQIAFEDVWKTA